MKPQSPRKPRNPKELFGLVARLAEDSVTGLLKMLADLVLSAGLGERAHIRARHKTLQGLNVRDCVQGALAPTIKELRVEGFGIRRRAVHQRAVLFAHLIFGKKLAELGANACRGRHQHHAAGLPVEAMNGGHIRRLERPLRPTHEIFHGRIVGGMHHPAGGFIDDVEIAITGDKCWSIHREARGWETPEGRFWVRSRGAPRRPRVEHHTGTTWAPGVVTRVQARGRGESSGMVAFGEKLGGRCVLRGSRASMSMSQRLKSPATPETC